MRILRKMKEPQRFFDFLKKKKRKFLKIREIEIIYLKSIFERKRGNFKKAEKYEKIILQKYPYSKFAKLIAMKEKGVKKDIIKVLFIHREWKKILEILKNEEKINPEMNFIKAYAFFKLKDYKNALKFFKISLSEGYKNKEKVNFYKGLTYLYLGDTTKAINSFSRNLIYENYFAKSSIRELRIIYLKSKKFRKRISRIIKKAKINEEVLYFYFDAENFKKVLKIIENVKDRNLIFKYLKFLITKDSELIEEIHKDSPLSYFSLLHNGLCIQKSAEIDETEIPSYDTLSLFLELKLEDDFWNRVGKIKDKEKLLKLSYLLNKDKKYYYSVKIARKAYYKYRKGENLCFDELLLKILFPLPYYEKVLKYVNKYKIDPALIYAIMRRESLFDTMAVSPKGAKGVMQLMEKTAKKVNNGKEINLFNLEDNIRTGIKHLRELIDSFDFYYAISAYNAGKEKIKEWKKFIPENEISIFFDIPYRETRNYLFYVLSDYLVYKLLYPELKLKE